MTEPVRNVLSAAEASAVRVLGARVAQLVRANHELEEQAAALQVCVRRSHTCV
jgi:hypothetical protein